MISVLLMVTSIMSGQTIYPMTDYTVQVYPQQIQVGDTIYIRVFTSNPHDQTAYVPVRFELDCHGMTRTASIDFSLDDPDNGKNFPLLVKSDWWERDYFSVYDAVPSGEQREIASVSFAIPALEDLHKTFWENSWDHLAQQDGVLILKTKINTRNATDHMVSSGEEVRASITLETPIVIYQRNSKEMSLLKQWYDDFPPDFFPTEWNGRKALPPEKVLMNQKHGKTTQVEYHGRTFEYTPQFTTAYPGNPNCPETWQGWKELEESLVPSTMRDEIRMKRIVIQYCDTEDSKVLDELTEWLQNMNEIQRVVMVQNVIYPEGKLLQNEEIGTPLNKLIETIRPFSAEVCSQEDSR